MNKYQKSLLTETSCSMRHCEENVWTGEKFFFKQNEDITLKDYVLCISNPSIEAVFAMEGDTQTPFEKKEGKFCFFVDFDHKIDGIKIVFQNGLADDLIVPVEYVEADKEAYYAQKEKERKDALLAAASIKCATGADLVNIYFQPCCKEYGRTEIALYRDNQMLAKYKVDEDSFFKSIGGLAYGTYSFILKQFDKAGKTILETTPMLFTIHNSRHGKPLVVI